MSNVLDNPNGTTGALLQNDMYAWIAEGTGRVDLSAEADMQFDYAAIASKSKHKIVNPLGHIQFAASLRQLRYMFCGNQSGGNGCAYPLSDYSLRTTINSVTDASLGRYILTTKNTIGDHNKNVDASLCSKFLFAPYVDEYSLVPSLVADLSDATYKYNLEEYATGVDMSFSNTSYATITIAPEAQGTVNTDFAIGSGLAQLNQDAFNFQIVDISNYTVDGSFSVVAAFNIYMKYGKQNGGAVLSSGSEPDQVWPKLQRNLITGSVDAGDIGAQLPPTDAATTAFSGDDSETEKLYFDKKNTDTFFLNGVPITVKGREVVVPVKASKQNHNYTLSGSQRGSTSAGFEDVSYIAQVMYGDLEDMSFVKGVMTKSNGSQFVCVSGGVLPGLKARADANTTTCVEQIKTEALTAGIDISFVARTLDDTSLLKQNSDKWMGDILLPITGKAADASGGLQCIHVPDALKNIRTDAAASLAANFAGLTELMGSITVEESTDVSYGEINRLSTHDLSGQIGSAGEDLSGVAGLVNGCYTIPGHVITSKLKNFMKGELNSDGTSLIGIDNTDNNTHAFKAVYSVGGKQWWASGGTSDTSAACVARNLDVSIADVTTTNTQGIDTGGGVEVDVTCEIAELTPQESAFFYLYPWASTQMCAIGSGADGAYVLDGETLDSTQTSDDTKFPRPTNDLSTEGADCNPFRQFAVRYLGNTAYTSSIGGSVLDKIKAAVPTAQGWWDLCGGYYNAKGRPYGMVFIYRYLL